MKRRRTTALSVSAAALLATAPLLSGCATDSHPGAAAVVGGERISLTEVQSAVQDVRDAQRDQPNADDLIATSPGLTRETVNFLVYLEIVEQAAADHHVEVSRRDVQQARDREERGAGGAEALRNAALMPSQGGMPLADKQIDQVLRSNLLFRGLAETLGGEPGAEGQRMAAEVLVETAEEAGVDINPRYGEWDARALSLVDARMPWLRNGTEDAQA